MSDKHEAASDRHRPVEAEHQTTAPGHTKLDGIEKPKIVAGSERGGLSGGADPGSTGAGNAGSDVGVAGISGQSTGPVDKKG